MDSIDVTIDSLMRDKGITRAEAEKILRARSTPRTWDDADISYMEDS